MLEIVTAMVKSLFSNVEEVKHIIERPIATIAQAVAEETKNNVEFLKKVSIIVLNTL